MMLKKILTLTVYAVLFVSVVYSSVQTLNAETVTGGGYTIEQVITPIQGAISGNGYVIQQSAQQVEIGRAHV